MKFENIAVEIERCFSKQFPKKKEQYNKLLRHEIKFPENVIEIWEEMIYDLDLIFKLARENIY